MKTKKYLKLIKFVFILTPILVSVTKAQSLHDAAKLGDLTSVSQVLKQGGKLDAKDSDGVTALMYASERGHFNVVEALLKQGADPNARSTGAGMTALMVASSEGHIGVVRMLLDANAEVDLKDWDMGITALTSAAQYGYDDVVKVLIAKGADVNAKSKLDRTALMAGSVGGHTDVVKILLDEGADVNIKDKKYGITALMGAAASGSIPVIKLLVENGSAIDSVDNRGMNAVDLARAKGHTTAARAIDEARSRAISNQHRNPQVHQDASNHSPFKLRPEDGGGRLASNETRETGLLASTTNHPAVKVVLSSRNAELNRDIIGAMEAYDDTVNYFDKKQTRADIKQDKLNYFKDWPEIQELLIGEVVVKEIRSDLADVYFMSSFIVNNPKNHEWIAGIINNQYRLQQRAGKWFVVTQTGKVSNLKKGVGR